MRAAVFPVVMVLGLVLSLSACDTGSAPDPAAPSGTNAGRSASEGTTAAGTGIGTGSAGANSPALPSAMQGRWGLKPEDCEAAGSMPTGLLTVRAKELQFYESVAGIARVAQASPNAIRAVFTFSGEGVSWERDQSLELIGNGDTLLRREYGMDAPTEPFTYSKCPQGE